jgi:hypothetical protein
MENGNENKQDKINEEIDRKIRDTIVRRRRVIGNV